MSRPVKNEQYYKERVRTFTEEMPEYCRNFLTSKIGHLKGISVYNYAADTLVFLLWVAEREGYNSTCDIPIEVIDGLTKADIEEYIEYLSEYQSPDGSIRRNSISAKSRKLSMLRSLYHYLNRARISYNDPTEFIKNPKLDNRNTKELTDTEKAAVIKSIETGIGYKGREFNSYNIAFNALTKQRNKAIFLLKYETKISVPKLADMNLDDVDLSNSRIKIKHNGVSTEIVMPRSVEIALKAYINEDRKELNDSQNPNPALFLTRRGDRMSIRNMQHMLKFYKEFALAK